MLKSEVVRVSGPSTSSKRSRQTPTPSSQSEDDDDEYEQQNDKDDEEEGEVRSKQTSKPPTTQTTPAGPSRIGGLYMPPAKLRLLQV
jgi:hypothetical protein